MHVRGVMIVQCCACTVLSVACLHVQHWVLLATDYTCTSLACHTPQSKGKRDLMNMCAASCFSARKPGETNQIPDFEFLLSNTLLVVHMHMASHAIFAVCCLCCFCNYCIPRYQLAICMQGHQNPLRLRVLACKTVTTLCTHRRLKSSVY